MKGVLEGDGPFKGILQRARRAGTGAVVGGTKDVAQWTIYGGRKYRSKMEARFAERLDLEKAAGLVLAWQPQVRLPIVVPDAQGGPEIHVCTYVVDFLVHYADGSKHLVETKGRWWPEAKLKRRLFEATWLRARPDFTYRIVTRLGPYGSVASEEGPLAERARAISPGPGQRTISAAEFRRTMNGRRS